MEEAQQKIVAAAQKHHEEEEEKADTREDQREEPITRHWGNKVGSKKAEEGGCRFPMGKRKNTFIQIGDIAERNLNSGAAAKWLGRLNAGHEGNHGKSSKHKHK